MSVWALLAGAILTEVLGTIAMRLAVDRKPWYLVTALGYGAAFTFLALALRAGMPLGMAYGIWSASGVALTALLSRVLFGERLTRTMVLGITLIMAGVLLIQLGATA
ncbi:DMT family transporter [Luteococcus sp. OSA5]|uniref:DMT family transporter n=1 Tax=Luteococcus sp. OSA5 TaxID=3401630 RepID=UPI003B429CDC